MTKHKPWIEMYSIEKMNSGGDLHSKVLGNEQLPSELIRYVPVSIVDFEEISIKVRQDRDDFVELSVLSVSANQFS